MMKSPYHFSAKALSDEIVARLLNDENRCAISKCHSGDIHCGWNVTAPRYIWIRAGIHPAWLRECKGWSLSVRVGTKRMKRARDILSVSLLDNKSIPFNQPFPAQVFHAPIAA